MSFKVIANNLLTTTAGLNFLYQFYSNNDKHIRGSGGMFIHSYLRKMCIQIHLKTFMYILQQIIEQKAALGTITVVIVIG